MQTSTLVVRGDELDRSGAVSPAKLLSYCEGARWLALGQGGPLAVLFSGGHKVLVRAQRAQIGQPARLGAKLTSTVWLASVGRTSLELGQQLVDESGAMVARLLLTVVHLGPEGRPVPVPAELAALAIGRGELEGLAAWTLGQEAPPADAFAFHFFVRASEIDLFQHVNHARYLDYFLDAKVFGDRGGQHTDWPEAAPLREVVLDYAAEAVIGEVVGAALWADGEPGVLHAALVREGKVLCRGLLRFG